jgi:hypothetical protein
MVEKYGLLTVHGVDPTDAKYRLVRCDCGTEKRVRRDHLMTGKTRSCGCLHKRLASERIGKMHEGNVKHGMAGSRVMGIWLTMRQRCNNANNPHYPYYGGRGITICERWNEFENFLADMGEPGPKMTIDRIDNAKGYEPDNCRWATRKEQQNNRRACRYVTYNGETKTVAQWAATTGIHRNTLDRRLAEEWPLERVFDPRKQENRSGLALGVAARQGDYIPKGRKKIRHADRV